jgi:curved DNA-binding protein CbpA
MALAADKYRIAQVSGETTMPVPQHLADMFDENGSVKPDKRTTPYAVLGVAIDASDEKIAAAHKEIVRQVSGNESNVHVLKLVDQANAILSNPKKKAMYDKGEYVDDNFSMGNEDTHKVWFDQSLRAEVMAHMPTHVLIDTNKIHVNRTRYTTPKVFFNSFGDSKESSKFEIAARLIREQGADVKNVFLNGKFYEFMPQQDGDTGVRFYHHDDSVKESTETFKQYQVYKVDVDKQGKMVLTLVAAAEKDAQQQPVSVTQDNFVDFNRALTKTIIHASILSLKDEFVKYQEGLAQRAERRDTNCTNYFTEAVRSRLSFFKGHSLQTKQSAVKELLGHVENLNLAINTGNPEKVLAVLKKYHSSAQHPSQITAASHQGNLGKITQRLEQAMGEYESILKASSASKLEFRKA